MKLTIGRCHTCKTNYAFSQPALDPVCALCEPVQTLARSSRLAQGDWYVDYSPIPRARTYAQARAQFFRDTSDLAFRLTAEHQP